MERTRRKIFSLSFFITHINGTSLRAENIQVCKVEEGLNIQQFAISFNVDECFVGCCFICCCYASLSIVIMCIAMNKLWIYYTTTYIHVVIVILLSIQLVEMFVPIDLFGPWSSIRFIPFFILFIHIFFSRYFHQTAKSFETQPLLLCRMNNTHNKLNTKQMHLSWNSMMLRYLLHKTIYLKWKM